MWYESAFVIESRRRIRSLPGCGQISGGVLNRLMSPLALLNPWYFNAFLPSLMRGHEAIALPRLHASRTEPDYVSAP